MFKPFFLNEKKQKKVKRTLILLILLLILGSLIYIKIYIDGARNPVSINNISEKSITIPQGSSTSTIAKILNENGIIRNENVFKIYSKFENRDGKYKAGIYTLNTGMSQEQVMDKLIEGGILRETVKFTIPEGFELRQIADRLSSQGIVEKEIFISLTSNISNFKQKYSFLKDLPKESSLEGYLYPNTYEVFKDSTEEEVIEKMLDNFEKVYTEDIKQKGKDLGLNINQIITLASIIEREAMVDHERNIMSGVFHNRLKIDMPLQSCATVQYVLGERKPILSNADTLINSDYNTYINKGLPPAPIASPGAKSIEAAVNPENVDYLFFVRTGEDGSHTFSITYNEHLNAKNSN